MSERNENCLLYSELHLYETCNQRYLQNQPLWWEVFTFYAVAKKSKKAAFTFNSHLICLCHISTPVSIKLKPFIYASVIMRRIKGHQIGCYYEICCHKAAMNSPYLLIILPVLCKIGIESKKSLDSTHFWNTPYSESPGIHFVCSFSELHYN